MKQSSLLNTCVFAGTLLLQMVALCFYARGAAGDVDLSFDPGSGIDGLVRAAALQPDGKVVIGGEFTSVKRLSRFYIARLNADGSGDATFDAGTVADRYVSAIVLQADGKILFTTDSFAEPVSRKAVRLNSNGTLDLTFVPAPKVFPADSGLTCAAVQTDGKVILGGHFTELEVDAEGLGQYVHRSLLVRLNADGSNDETFTSGNGRFDQTISTVVLQPDGKILLASGHGIARLDIDGKVDSGFHPASDGFVLAMAVRPDGRIVLAGGDIWTGAERNTSARLNADGSLDDTFHPATSGIAGVNCLALLPGGKALLGGGGVQVNGVRQNGIVRLNDDGSVDHSFNIGAGADAPNNAVWALAAQPDGKIFIVGGFTTFDGLSRERIARLHAGGSVDATFDPGAGINGSITALSLQADGRVLIGGNFTTVHGRRRNGIARLHSDGSLDESFDPGEGISDPFDPRIAALILQADGRIIIGGRFVSVRGTPRNRIARLNPDGSLDSSYNPVTGGHDLDIHCLALYPGGKLLVGGDPKLANGANPNGIFRLHSNGSMDASFTADVLGNAGGYYTGINALAVQPDGKIVAGGYFVTVMDGGDLYDRLLIRLKADGSGDTDFTSTAVGPDVRAMAMQPDGRLLAGSARYDGMLEPAIFRLNTNGTPDDGFHPGSGSPWDVNWITLQPDGRILAYQNGVARLHADGSPDNTFHSVPLAPDTVLVQPDGRLLAAGSFGAVNGVLRPRIARLYGDSQPPISFAVWAASFGLSGNAARPDADPDLDGLPNGAEYVLGEVPSRMSAAESSRPAATMSDGQMRFTFVRADASESPDIALSVETSNDLASWSADFIIGPDTAASSPGVSITENGVAPDTITVAIPQGSEARKFARLKVAVTR
jgi:uncharacterized delta-60 repeat protein